MLVRLVSDLHLEFGKDWEPALPPMEGDEDTILIAAGDIDTGVDACEFLQQASSRFAHVLYVLGNHEYYGNDLTTLPADVREELGDFDKVTLLDMDSIVLGDVRFVGTTLWADCERENPTAMVMIEQGMRDYDHIKNAGKRTTAPDLISIHKENKQFLVDTLSEEHDGPTIVVTHHLPSFKSVHPMFHKRPMSYINGAFYSNLEDVMHAFRIDYWLHGHTHQTLEYEVAGTKVRMNPLGYGPVTELENGGFRTDWRIEV